MLEAAGTKWNFLPFRPGLVGGHCIGVDPYYLTHKAEEVGYIPQVILAGRRINDGMGAFIANRTIREMTRAGHPVSGAPVTVLGLTFKEDCPDLRNSRVIDIVRELQDFGALVQVADPLADPEEALHEYGVRLTPFDKLDPSAAVVAAVSHREYRALTADGLAALCLRPAVVIDVKGAYDRARSPPPASATGGCEGWPLNRALDLALSLVALVVLAPLLLVVVLSVRLGLGAPVLLPPDSAPASTAGPSRSGNSAR